MITRLSLANSTLQQLTEPMVAPPPAPSTSTTVASTPSFSATEISEATVDGQDSDTADPALPAAMHRVCMSDATTTTAVSLGEEVVPNSVA